MKKRWIFAIVVALTVCITCAALLPTQAQAATDYSDYTMQLWAASSGGASGPMYVDCYYLEYNWWTDLEYASGSMSMNDRFETRLRFEKDTATGKYRLYYYGVHAFDGTLYTRKYYLTGATVPEDCRSEDYGFYYGSLYGYEYITLTSSSSDALLWEITASGYLKTTYKGRTHYLWTTTTPYSSYDGARYNFRLRTSTTAKGSYGMPVDTDNLWFDFSNRFHAHTPGEKQMTGVTPGTCNTYEITSYALFCADETCGAKLASTNKYGRKDPSNHVELAERLANESPATCQAPYSYYKETYCTGCNIVIATEGPFQEGEALGHDLTQHEAKSPTCTEVGWEAYESCSRCDFSTYEELPANGHSFGDWTVLTNATCTEEGVLGRDCQICGSSETSTFPANGHVYIAAATAPTCTQQGYTTHTCTHCGDSYMDTYVPETGHSFGQWYVHINATCTEEGQNRRDCQICDGYETSSFPANGHAYIVAATAPTCTQQGYTTHTCTHCGESYMDTYVPETGHSFGQWYVHINATCTEEGQNRRDCQNCDHYETSAFPETGHSFGQWYVQINATCTEDGQLRRDCENCDGYETSPFLAIGHEYTSVVTEPTCTQQGYTTHTCANCGDSYKNTYVSAIGHSFGQWYIETKATCTENGQLRRDCANCGDYESAALPATGHTYEAVVTEPTWGAGGYTTYTCRVCGSSYIGDHTDPLPYIPGDVTNNGVVDTDDAIYLLYHTLFGEGDYPLNQSCDFDQDGNVDTDDAIYLLYHTLFGAGDYPLN